MKKLVIALIFAALMAGSVSALDWEGYPDSVKEGNWLINAGVGFGSPQYGSITVPPLSVSVDYILPLGGLPFSVGGMFGFNRSKESYVSSHVDYTYLAFGGRFGYHPDLGVKNLDAYGVITLGYYRRSWKSSLSGSSSFSSGTFLWGGAVGGRYFFTNNIGAFLELGYSALSFVTGGIAIKF